MRPIDQLITAGKNLYVLGIDDSPFERDSLGPVHITGVFCRNTRFEGMLCSEITKDALDATDVISSMILNSKFYEILNVVLLDGITIGGFNMIDLPELHKRIDRPCISVVRKYPDFERIYKALDRFDDKDQRIQIIKNAGEVFEGENIFFQTAGCSEDIAKKILNKVSDRGVIPEAVRIAHLVGSAVVTGQSGNRA